MINKESLLEARACNLVSKGLDGGMWGEWGDNGLGEPCLRLIGVSGQVAFSDRDLNDRSLSVLEKVVSNMNLQYVKGSKAAQVVRILAEAPECHVAQAISSMAVSERV